MGIGYVPFFIKATQLLNICFNLFVLAYGLVYAILFHGIAAHGSISIVYRMLPRRLLIVNPVIMGVAAGRIYHGARCNKY